MNNSALETRRLNLAYEGKSVISGLNLLIPTGKITALVSPNGCGKSTLLRGLARLLKPHVGTVYLNGADIFQQSTTKVAQQLGILPQAPVTPEGLTVRDLVALKSGEVFATGEPQQVMTEAMVQQVFGLECRIVPDPVTGTPWCVPLTHRR